MTSDNSASKTVVLPGRAPKKGEVPLYMEHGRNYPRATHGTFRIWKWWAMAITLAWWHLAPFLRWDRGPGVPDQAILIDMPGRRAYFFNIEIWPQEVYYITGILLLSAIFLFLMSAVAGRLWCGFLCWQTVYTDLFVAMERIVIGSRSKRIAFDRAPWSLGKLARTVVLNLSWLAISAACGIGFTLWFGDARDQLRDIFTGEAGTASYVFIGVIGGFCFLLAGYARERVCVYLCPYSRFQSAMFDEHSLIVTYQAWRGEPHGHAKPGENFAGRGHCVDCHMCQQSCPTGVDIRKGNQLACIGCGLCIDACDTVMAKFGLPKGLISMVSSANLEAREKGEQPTGMKLVRPRTLIYAGLMAVVGTVMLAALLTRTPTDVNILHERAPLYVQLSDGGVRNGYVYKVLRKIRVDAEFTLRIDGIPGATLDVVGGDSHTQAATLQVAGDDVGSFRLYVTAPAASLKGASTPITFVLEDKATGRVVRSETVFAGP